MEKTTYRGDLWSIILDKYYSDYQIKRNEMDWTYGKYGRKKKCQIGFW